MRIKKVLVKEDRLKKDGRIASTIFVMKSKFVGSDDTYPLIDILC